MSHQKVEKQQVDHRDKPFIRAILIALGLNSANRTRVLAEFQLLAIITHWLSLVIAPGPMSNTPSFSASSAPLQ